jgi:hypothetical protein
MVQIILGIVVVIVVGVLAFAAAKPNTFRIERTGQIDAPREKVFPLIDDFRNWTQWSPWENVDPALKRTYSGAPRGVGAIYAWDGSDKVGSGRMEITQSAAPSKVILRLEFIKPFAAVNTTEFTITPSGAGSTVSWAMYGPASFMHKFMGTLFNMDAMLAKQFDTGLAKLKAAAEK